MMLSEEQIKTKIIEIEKQRDALVEQANRDISFLNGQITALKELIKVEEVLPTDS